jgi:hypothetical protein
VGCCAKGGGLVSLVVTPCMGSEALQLELVLLWWRSCVVAQLGAQAFRHGWFLVFFCMLGICMLGFGCYLT